MMAIKLLQNQKGPRAVNRTVLLMSHPESGYVSHNSQTTARGQGESHC